MLLHFVFETGDERPFYDHPQAIPKIKLLQMPRTNCGQSSLIPLFRNRTVFVNYKYSFFYRTIQIISIFSLIENTCVFSNWKKFAFSCKNRKSLIFINNSISCYNHGHLTGLRRFFSINKFISFLSEKRIFR